MLKMRGASRRRRSRSWRSRLWDGFLTVAVLGLLVLLSARLDRRETSALEGRVVVNDGDSLTLDGGRIRLRGIDAPEFSQVCKRAGVDYPCGKLSRDALVTLIGGRAVSCRGWERDRYDRLLATCTVGDIELNRRQVEAGWAVAYGAYRSEEEAARRESAGLWAGSFDRPQDWRQMHGGMAETEHVLPGILDWMRSRLGLQ
ncbi:MAG: thermonuclease family protein [Mesorhizobium sp.]|nr:thermonuclease family protein [Mesorhizobium sp.]MBL8578544.1 thermonuclease family protein [Mesorhizobium sp.]